jgi:hypothetical protein
MARKSKDDEIVLLLKIRSRDEWHDEILRKIDMHPLGFDDLAREFGFPDRNMREYLDLIILVGDLQEEHGGKDQIIKSAFVEGTNIYPLFRSDQEQALVDSGVLTEEYDTDVVHIAMEEGMSGARHVLRFHGKER